MTGHASLEVIFASSFDHRKPHVGEKRVIWEANDESVEFLVYTSQREQAEYVGAYP